MKTFDEMLADRNGFTEALASQKERIVWAAQQIAAQLKRGNKLIIFGNGGSAADAQHMAAEFVGRFGRDRPGLSAIALTTDSSALTAIGNDWNFDYVFKRQLEALGRPGDVVLGISTSGASKNVLEALDYASELELMVTIGLTSKDDKDMGTCCHEVIEVGGSTPICQERMLAVEHLICELVDEILSKGINDTKPLTIKRYCFDIDGTLCVSTGGHYQQAKPYKKRIERVNALYDAGHHITLYTARGTKTGIDHTELTKAQVSMWGIKHHELKLGKPEYDVFIDDRALSDTDFFGYYKE